MAVCTCVCVSVCCSNQERGYVTHSWPGAVILYQLCWEVFNSNQELQHIHIHSTLTFIIDSSYVIHSSSISHMTLTVCYCLTEELLK